MKIEFSLPCDAIVYYAVEVPEEFIKDCHKKKMTFYDMLLKYDESHNITDFPIEKDLEWLSDGDIYDLCVTTVAGEYVHSDDEAWNAFNREIIDE